MSKWAWVIIAAIVWIIAVLLGITYPDLTYGL